MLFAVRWLLKLMEHKTSLPRGNGNALFEHHLDWLHLFTVEKSVLGFSADSGVHWTHLVPSIQILFTLGVIWGASRQKASICLSNGSIF